jgi:hypothetical protein
VPADGTSLPRDGNGDFGTSPFYGQQLHKRYQAIYLHGLAGREAQVRLRNINHNVLIRALVSQFVGPTELGMFRERMTTLIRYSYAATA